MLQRKTAGAVSQWGRQARYLSKHILSGVAARQKLLAGCNTAVDAVEVTLGPSGRNVLIEQPFGGPKMTKDGVTVAKAIELTDRLENMGAQFVKDVASATNDVAGDGTTTSSVLARCLFQEITDATAHGANPRLILEGMNMALQKVVEYLENRSTPVVGVSEMQDVATISCNGDATVGKLVADAFQKVGPDGTVAVLEGRTAGHSLEMADGMRLDRGYMSPYFVNTAKSSKTELENCRVLLYDRKITSIKSLIPLLEQAVTTKTPLLLVCDELDTEVLALLILNKVRMGLNVCAIQAPGFGESRLEQLQDLAVALGGKIISEEIGDTLENVNLGELGFASKIIVSKDETILVAGNETNKRQEVKERIEDIRKKIAESTSEYEKDRLQERKSRLAGGIAILKVGGNSEMEMQEAKDRVQDAICATRSALQEGVLPGGGTAILFAANQVLNDQAIQQLSPDPDVLLGAKILKKACVVPACKIASNAGYEGKVVVGTLTRDHEFGQGFNARTGKVVNFFDKGIIDPTKVVKCALSDAVRGASLMGTTEAIVCEIEEEKK